MPGILSNQNVVVLVLFVKKQILLCRNAISFITEGFELLMRNMISVIEIVIVFCPTERGRVVHLKWDLCEWFMLDEGTV